MTTERNAQGVDVLAVMQASADQLWRYRRDILAREEEEARAAVAELVEAAQLIRNRTKNIPQSGHRSKADYEAHVEADARLLAALAKFPEPRP